MDFETLYRMAASAARNAERMCNHEGQSSFRNYAGYSSYVDEYNRLLTFTSRVDPDVTQFLPLIEAAQRPSGGVFNPGVGWKARAELAAIRLNSLASYLQSKLGKTQQEYELVIDTIRANLRPAMHGDPSNEREVQNALEIIFRARGFDFRREQETVPFSTKRYIPDFTFDRIGLAVEVKLCKDKDRERPMIDEINADIIGYGGKYDRCIFVIYDLGFIRDIARFSEDIEKNPGAHVLIVKK